MKRLHFNEIKVFDDTMDDMDIIRDIIKTESRESAFYLADIGGVIKKHQEWISKMPRVIPHFAIKCNPDPTVIKVLAAMNACFDCASEGEIRQVMQYGVEGDRIIFAHPTKLPSHIKYAKKVDVKQMTVDSELELYKIKDLFPEAEIIIRIRCDARNTPIVLGVKFGCETNEETISLIQLTKDLGLNLCGFSFHVGSQCGEPEAFSRGIATCKQLIDISKAIGCENARLIDIGGGFSGVSSASIDNFADIINDAIKDFDSDIKIISEPGSYYVTSSFSLASYLHSKRIISKNGKIVKMYFMDCGAFNAFIEELLNLQCRIPQLLSESVNDEKFLSILWGPTAGCYDVIIKDVLLPEYNIGDWLVWKDMGSYSIALSTTFNGFPVPDVIPIIRKSEWEDFKKIINRA